MGCAASRSEPFTPEKGDRLWKGLVREEKVKDDQQSYMISAPLLTKLAFSRAILDRHDGWAILRLNLISTYKDFKNERSVIHDMESRDAFADEESIYSLVHVLEESKADNQQPFYLHLIGECTGYIIDDKFEDDNLLTRYSLPKGVSLNEAASLMLNIHNPNALFMQRSNSFLEEIPFHENKFIEDENLRMRANYFAEQVEKMAPPEQFVTYKVTTQGINNPRQKQIQFSEMNEFKSALRKFLLTRIEKCFDWNGRNESAKTSSQIVHEYYSGQKCPISLADEVEKIRLLTLDKQVVIVTGEGGCGRSTILHTLAASSKCAFASATEFTSREKMAEKIMNETENRKGEYRTAMASYGGEKRFVIIDDADDLSKEDLLYLVSPCSALCYILSARKSVARWFLTLKVPFALHHMPSMDIEVAKALVAVHLDFVTPIPNEKPSDKAMEKVKLIFEEKFEKKSSDSEKEEAKKKTNEESEANVEDVAVEPRNEGEAQLEVDGNRPSLDGNRRERASSAGDSVSAHSMSSRTPYCADKYGGRLFVSALRWRKVCIRLGHLFRIAHLPTHHIIIPAFARKAVAKRYFTTIENVQHLQKRIAKFLASNYYFVSDREMLKDLYTQVLEKPKKRKKTEDHDNEAFDQTSL